MKLDKSKICFIAATIKGDYVFEGIKNSGYQIMIPYRDTNLLMRCMRELWYRLCLPAKHLWYNPACKKIDADLFIVRDSLMSAISWMAAKAPSGCADHFRV